MKTVTFKAKVSHNKKDNSTNLVLEGDLSLKNAREIRKTIQSLKPDSDTIELEIRDVEKLDITTIQTINAYGKFLAGEGKTVRIRMDLIPETGRLLKNAGFDFSIQTKQ